jgi:hypothetical protein
MTTVTAYNRAKSVGHLSVLRDKTKSIVCSIGAIPVPAAIMTTWGGNQRYRSTVFMTGANTKAGVLCFATNRCVGG